MGEPAVVLIGGTSHVGKSTVALALADELGWRHVSTDRLARHPGRPWTTDRPHVHEHYATLTVAELTAAQLAHYERMWPLVEELVRDALAPGRGGLVLEGSGVWPDRVAGAARGPGRRGLVDRRRPDAARPRAPDQPARRPSPGRAARRSRSSSAAPLGYQARLIEEIDRLGLTRVAVGDGHRGGRGGRPDPAPVRGPGRIVDERAAMVVPRRPETTVVGALA